MDLLADLTTRLTPLGVPVLQPEQRELPAQGRKPGEAGGLSGYLTAHPTGYVQLNPLQPLRAALDGAAAIYVTQLDVLAPTPGAAQDLTDRARRAVTSHPGVRHTPYDLLTPPAASSVTGGTIIRFTVTARTTLAP